jgi:hypothetical protein
MVMPWSFHNNRSLFFFHWRVQGSKGDGLAGRKTLLFDSFILIATSDDV